MFTLEDFVEPSRFAQQYAEAPETLAINFGSLLDFKLYNILLSIPSEVSDPLTFIWSTEYHEALCAALSEALSGLDQYGCKVLPLVEEMGFGKTHFLILLWHLFTDIATNWDDVEKRPELYEVVKKLEECGYKPSRALNTLIVPLDTLRAIEKDDPYQYFINNVVKACEYKGKSDVAREIARLKKLDPIQAAAELATIAFDSKCNLLVLVDEVYAAVSRCTQSDNIEKISSVRKIATLLTHLIDAVANKAPTILVYASAQQDVDTWSRLSANIDQIKPSTRLEREKSDLVNAVKDFESRAGRKAAIGLAATKPSHAVSIAIKRLLNFKVDRKKAYTEISNLLQPKLKQLLADEKSADKYLKDIEETFPFTRDYLYLAEKLMQRMETGDLPKTQHLRDILRITSLLLRRLQADQLWNRVMLISPAYLLHDDIKHLLPPNLAQEWGRVYGIGKRAIEAEVDEGLRRITSLLHNLLYLRAFTANGLKILNMLRESDVVALEELRSRGATPKDLLAHLPGAVEDELLAKAHEAIANMLNHRVPFVMPIERGGERYLVMTILMNPLQLLEAIKEEELSKLKTPDGRPDIQKMRRYLEDHLAKEGFIHQLINRAKDMGVNILIPRAETFFDEKKASEEFINRLNNEVFNVVVIHPTSVLELERVEDYEQRIQEYLIAHKGDIDSPNMFAIVTPTLTEETLKELCGYLADVDAADRLHGYYKAETPEEAKMKRKQLAEAMPTYPMIKEFCADKPDFEEIVDEVMRYLQKRVENFVAALLADKFTNYVTALCNIFNKIVTYSPKHNTFVVDEIHVTRREELEGSRNVYAHLPLWLFNAVKSTCQVFDTKGLKPYLLDYFSKEAERSKDRIIKEGCIKIPYSFIINALKKGWAEIPVKPLSVQNIEASLELFSGVTIAVEDPQLREVSIEASVENKEKYIMLKKLERPVGGVPPPPPPPIPKVIGITVNGLDNVMIALHLTEREKENLGIRSLSSNIKFEDGGVSLTNLTTERFEKIFGGYGIFRNKLGTLRHTIKEISFTVHFAKSLQREDVKQLCDKYGLKGCTFIPVG